MFDRVLNTPLIIILLEKYNYFTKVTTNRKYKPTKIVPKVHLKRMINTFQNQESIYRIQLVNPHSKSSLEFEKSQQTCRKEKNLKTNGFVTFSGSIEMEHLAKMG